MARWNQSDALKSLIYKQLPSYFLTYFANGELKIEDTGGHLTFSSVWIIFLCVSFPLCWHFISEKIQSRGLARLFFKKYLRNAWVQLDDVTYHLMWIAWHPALDISNCWCSNKQHIKWVKPFLSHLKYFSSNFISFNKKQNHATWFFYTLRSVLKRLGFYLSLAGRGLWNCSSTQKRRPIWGWGGWQLLRGQNRPPVRAERQAQRPAAPYFPPFGREVSASLWGQLAWFFSLVQKQLPWK